MTNTRMIEVQNINTPGRSSRVNAEIYEAMRTALLQALPEGKPGMTQAEMLHAIQPYVDQSLWPGGEKSGWWMKTVQLDLEAKSVVKRNIDTKPTRWHR